MLFEICGDVLRPCSLSFDDLRQLPDQVPDVSVIVPGRSGGAVRLDAVLAAAGAHTSARYLTVTAADGTFMASVPLAGLHDAVLVYRLGNGPLPVAQGGPVRLLIPQAGACAADEIDACANVKHVCTLTLSRERGADTRPTTATAHRVLHESPRRGG